MYGAVPEKMNICSEDYVKIHPVIAEIVYDAAAQYCFVTHEVREVSLLGLAVHQR